MIDTYEETRLTPGPDGGRRLSDCIVALRKNTLYCYSDFFHGLALPKPSCRLGVIGSHSGTW